jgi:4-amino-4-deoxy-L-arabinose transferase-like glycosyltransferase
MKETGNWHQGTGDTTNSPTPDIPHPFLRFSPYLTLLLWVLPLVLLRSSQQSLMAHDEGIYAMQARSILSTGDWITPQWGGGFSFDRTIGIQWLIAGCYSLFGVSEGTARLPSAIAWIFSVLLTYRIGSFLLNPRLAWLGAAIFSIIPLVVQYGRLATQDAVLVFIELLGIWALLEADQHKSTDRTSPLWYVLAGSTVGLGFLIKGFMIIPAAIALLPYAIRRRHIFNPWLYLGLGLGAIPPIGWLAAAINKYGVLVPEQLFGKLFHLGEQTYQGATPFYYVWNIPANGFPWVFFALGGVWLSIRNADLRKVVKSNQAGLLLVGYPVILFGELTTFGTRTHYYPLQLMPFVGLLGAIGLDHLVHLYQNRQQQSFLTGLNALIGGLAIAMIALVIGIQTSPQLRQLLGGDVGRGAIVGLIIGLGWLGLAVIWFMRHRAGLIASSKSWLAGWLLTSWLALAMMNLTGLWGNYDPELKTFLQRSEVQDVLRSQTVDFMVYPEALDRGGRKTYLLLSFYTPNIGIYSYREPENSTPDRLLQRRALPAWVDPNLAKQIPSDFQTIATFEGWQLIRKK